MKLLNLLFGTAPDNRFHGGLHVPAHKTQSTQTPAIVQPIEPEYRLSLRQRDGGWLEPVVKTGEYVLAGQLIARPGTRAGLNLHAPTSGTITAIAPLPDIHPSGTDALTIVLAADGKDEHAPALPALDDTAPTPVLLKRIEDAGIAGLGGAGFPAFRKLAHPSPVLLINAAECEPYITCDDMQIRECAAAIVRGAQLTAHIVNAERIHFGIEDDKPQAIQALKTAIEQAGDAKIQLTVIPAKYPSGNSRQLIELLEHQRIPSHKHTADYGIIVHNSATIKAIDDALILGRPLIERYTTITGVGLIQPHNRMVRIGTPLESLIHAAGGLPENSRLVIGGPMMGEKQQSLAAGLSKTTNCLLVLPQTPAQEALDCIRCARCSDACPMSLLPQQLHWYSQNHNSKQLQQHRLFDCIECGICAAVCPSNIPLVEQYKASKTKIRHEKTEQAAAERAKARHEAREARLAREAAERQAKMQAKRDALQQTAAENRLPGTQPADKTAAIEAAKARAAARRQAQSQNPNQHPDATDTAPIGQPELLRSTPPAAQSPAVPDKTAAIEAAKARAAARRAARLAEQAGEPEHPPIAAPAGDDDREAKLAAAKAKAEARRAARLAEKEQAGEPDNPPAAEPAGETQNAPAADDREAKLAAAKAKAEARRAARLAEKEQAGAPEHPPAGETETAPAANDREVKLAAAKAKAEARRQARTQSKDRS